jgi:hypothetical protein
MNTRTLYYVIGILVTILLIGGFLIVKNYADEQDKSVNQESPSEDMIIVYKKGKEIKLLSDSPYFQELKSEIENFTINIDNGYELIPSESRFNKLKKKGYAVELKYGLPKELKINFLIRPTNIKSVVIPLSGSDFPSASVFVYEDQKKFPHTLANTKQTKDNLLKLIEFLN